MTECPQAQCHSDEPRTLHSGYVLHKARGEDACAESTSGHNEYMRLKRAAKREDQQND